MKCSETAIRENLDVSYAILYLAHQQVLLRVAVNLNSNNLLGNHLNTLSSNDACLYNHMRLVNFRRTSPTQH